MDSIFIARSSASVMEEIFCYMSGLLVSGSSPWMYHSLWCDSWRGLVSLPNASLNLCIYSQAVSTSLCLIYLISVIPCCSNWGNWNSARNSFLISTKIGAYPLARGSTNFMYHLRDLPLRVVWNSTSLEASRVAPDLQMASHRYQCCSTSSSPLPQNYG